MGRLVPFPDTVDSLPDADLLDLSVSLSSDPKKISASARYATSARRSQIEAFYEQQFAAAGTTVSRLPLDPHRG